jgi:proteasome lid subunit RPN8/RPN11
LFVTRSSLRQIGKHAEVEGRESHFGFLLGNLYRCPESGVHYAVADRVVPTAEPLSEEAPNPYLLRAWADSQEAFREHGGVLIGWYHTHYMLGLMLSDGDREMNERYFEQPWQCCVLLVPDPNRPLGALYRPSAAQAGSEGEPAVFRELLAVEGIPASGPIPTALRWKNYASDRDVVPEVADPPAPEEVETPPVVSVRTPSGSQMSSVTLVLPDNRSERMYPRLPVRRRTIMWLLAAVAVAIGGYVGGMQIFRSGAEPIPVEPVGERPPPLAPEVQRFRDAATGLEESMLRYEERREDFDLGRIGCELLAGGYAAADDSFIVMAGAYAGLGTTDDEALNAEYERLVEEMNGVNEHFDASRCPRPQ